MKRQQDGGAKEHFMNYSRAILAAAIFPLSLFLVNPLYAGEYKYAEVLQKSMWFYEVQRSGVLPADNRVEWRGSSAVDDGKDVGHDLSGGWYDAGDNMKFNFPMASAVTLLAWGGLEYGDGYRKTGQWGWLLNNIRWATDYFIKCHTAPDEFYGQIGRGMIDHKWWGAPEDFPNERPAFKIDVAHPGSEFAAEAAAALASSSMLFRGTDAAYADCCLKHARELFAFADEYRGLYHEAITDAVDFYKSWSGCQDELVWAALWLYIATKETSYLEKAENGYGELPKEPQSTKPKYKEALTWDDKTYGCYVLCAKITNKAPYHLDAQRWLDWWSYGYAVRRSSGGNTWSSDSGVAYTPGGLAWVRQWGPLRYAANTAFAAFVYSDCRDVPAEKKTLYREWAKMQIDFALGDNELKRSYVCEFGTNPPVKPHHRSMHGPYLDDNGRTPEKSRHVLYGALVGGPGQDGSFIDDRLDAVRNEVAVDYNAGFSSALARLVEDYGGSAIADFPPPAVRDTEYTVVAKINTQGDRFTEISATVQNKTTWPARYSDKLKIRYYVDLSEVVAAGLTAADVKTDYRNCDLCSAPLNVSELIKAPGGADLYYTEISFDNERIFPGGQSAYRREVQFRIGLPDTAPQTVWDPDNDPSFAGLTNTVDAAEHRSIPAYENGLLVWGEEVDGTKFTPAQWNRPDFTEPVYAASGWDHTLFKGVGPEAVRFGPRAAKKGAYALDRTMGGVRITALENLRVGLFQLDGKCLKTARVKKGGVVSIHLTGTASNIVLLHVAGHAPTDRYLVCRTK
ncbi:MAG: glycoside hydrolase family 9 protein [Chitinispirillaceae bacterium]|nr:glycoside hydrolase family 9 protein [Chitinispirillaceae bacterium]